MGAQARTAGRRTHRGLATVFALVSALGPQAAHARGTPPATPAPAGPEGPARDLEAGRLLAELAQATDDEASLAGARDGGFVARALDRLDFDAAAAGDPHLFAATRTAFAATPAPAYAALARAVARYLARLAPHNAHVTMLAELVTQIAFNAERARDARADGIERATLATLDDADYLDAAINQERHALGDAADGDWPAIARLARALEATLDGIEPPDSPDVAPG